jgi:hypothetical protein
MVTAPVHKGVINDAGIPFSGHTEYLAEKTATPRVVMMLAGGGLRVALVTTHLPLRDVPAAVTQTAVEETLRILHREMAAKYGIARPRILVAGLNPHAGEGGYLGHEEIEVIAPVLERLRAEGMTLLGPLPADTMFSRPSSSAATACSPCTTTRALPRSSTRVLATASTSRWACRSSAPRLIMARRLNWRAADGPIPAACWWPSSRPSRWWRAPLAAGQRQGMRMSAHVARKRFGQNFLVDQQVIAEIIEQLAVQRGEKVVEIGPGWPP